MPPETINNDFRQFLDERFKRVDDALRFIRESLIAQDNNRAAQFASLEARYQLMQARVDRSDDRLKVVSGLSAGVGGILGAILSWVASHFLGLK